MSATELGAVCLLVSGVVAWLVARLRGAYTGSGLQMLIELWTAAALLHLTETRTLLAIAMAASVVALRVLLGVRRQP